MLPQPLGGQDHREGRHRPPERALRGDRQRPPRRHDLAVRRLRRDGRPDADDGAVRQADPAADGPGQRAALDRRHHAGAHRRRRPAGRRRLRHAQAAAGRSAAVRTRSSRRSSTARRRSCCSPPSNPREEPAVASRHLAAVRNHRDRPRPDPGVRRDRPVRPDLAAGLVGHRAGAGDPRVHPLPQAGPHRAARLDPPPLPRRARVRLRARGHPRHRRVRGGPRRRVPRTRAARRRGRPGLDRRAAVVHRRHRDDGDLVGRVRRVAGRGAETAEPAGDRHLVVHRRPLRRRHALHGRLPAVGQRRRVRHDVRLRDAAAGPGGRRRPVA